MGISERLVYTRERAGCSRSQLARELGRPYSTITKYETGEREPSHAYLVEVARRFGVSADYLLGLSDDPAPAGQSDLSQLPEDALRAAKAFSQLDQPGKNVVQVVLAEEGKRVQAEKERRRLDPASPSQTRFIPLYYTPAAAGLTEPAAGEDFDYIEVGPEVPRKADCAIRISGKSMEPYIKDKSIVYVTREPLENGDVGIFYVDGDMLCKQYYRDHNGHVRLLSLNRDYAQADRFIHARDTDTNQTYYGKVLLEFRPRIVI